MKQTVSPYMCQGEYVSRNDLILALLWMFFAEVRAEQHPVSTAAELPLHGIAAYLISESLKAGIKVVPNNYCGNASLGLRLSAARDDLEGKTYCEALAFLALKIRKALNHLRTDPAAQAGVIMRYYHVSNLTEFGLDPSVNRFALSNFSKTAVTEVDFGKGVPVLAHLTIVLPSYGATPFAGPGPRNGESQLVYCQFTEDERKFLKHSVVIQTCAPGLKCLYSDFTLDEMKELLGMI